MNLKKIAFLVVILVVLGLAVSLVFKLISGAAGIVGGLFNTILGLAVVVALVLIVLWVLASLTDLVYVPVVANFAVFFLNDALAFCRWKRREVRQAVRVTDTAG